MALGIGDRLPSFSLEDQNGDLRTPASVQGRWLVLFFYPKDDTPGCTAEACSFRDNAESFACGIFKASVGAPNSGNADACSASR